MKVIERVKSMSRRTIHLVIAGPPRRFRRKSEQPDAKPSKGSPKLTMSLFSRIADIAPSRGWLTKLVTPLDNPRVGATTTYRWLIPVQRNGKSGLGERGRIGLEREHRDDAWRTFAEFLLGRRDGDPPAEFPGNRRPGVLAGRGER